MKVLFISFPKNCHTRWLNPHTKTLGVLCIAKQTTPLESDIHFTIVFFQEEEKANMTHSRLSELCRTVATEHVLHKYNIKTPSLVSSKPAKLICQLYENYGARDPAKIHQPPGKKV